MPENPPTTPEAPHAPAGAAEGADPPGPVLDGGKGSLLAKLRAQREAIGTDLETVLDVPGHHGLLCAKYRLLPFRRVNAMADGVRKGDATAELNAAAELLADACVEVLVRDPESDRLLPIDPNHQPTRFDAHLMEMLKIDVPPGARPRDLVRLAFNRDYAVMSTQSDLVDWMQASHAVADGEFAGK